MKKRFNEKTPISLDMGLAVADPFMGSAQLAKLLQAARGPAAASPPASIIPALPAMPTPPNWTDRIVVRQQDYVLPAGQYLLSTSTFALINGDNFYNSKLVNDGLLWEDATLPPNLSGGVQSTAVLDVDVVNHGTIVAFGHVDDQQPRTDAYGIREPNSLTNSGQIFAVSQHGWARGVDTTNAPVIANSGLIAAQADVGGIAIGIWLHNGGSLSNQAGGQILAEAGQAVAVSLGRGITAIPDPTGQGIQIVNAGLIQAASLDPGFASEAIQVSNLGIDREAVRIVNTGTIRGDFAIADDSDAAFTPVQPAVQIVTNQVGGQIIGVIDLARGDDVITNAGSIVGDVFLGEGADRFETTTGSFHGIADMGWGNDNFIGSPGDDLAAGNDGNDTLEGRDGNDLLMGGGNDDVLIGGAGNDGLFGEYGNDRIVTQAGDFVWGGAGDDRIELGDYAFEQVSGGDGFDTLVLPGGSRVLDLSAVVAQQAIDGIEAIVLGGNKELVVRATDVPAVADGTVLRVDGTATDTIDLVGAWTSLDPTVIGDLTYRTYQLGGETVLVSGQAGVTVRDAAPTGATGLDPLAPGNLAPLPGDGRLDFTPNDLYLDRYVLSAGTTVVNPEEIWWNDGGTVIEGDGGSASLTNFGTLVSQTDVPDGPVVFSALYLHNISLENHGVVAAQWTGDDGQVLALPQEALIGIVDAITQGNVTNYGLIDAETIRGSATAVNQGGILKNFNEISASSTKGYAIAVDNPGLFENHGLVRAEGFVAIGVQTYNNLQNDGTIIAAHTPGGVDAIGVKANETFDNMTFTNNGSITADIAFQVAIDLRSGQAPFRLINSGSMDGRVELSQSNDNVTNSGKIVGDVMLGAGNDQFDGHAGWQLSVHGEDGNDTLVGGINMDTLDGGAGADILTGGAGQDRLTGGAGSDSFVFTSLADSGTGAFRSDGAKFLPDIIKDFVPGTDKIDLSQIDAIAGTAANDAFTFIGTAAFSHHAGELRVSSAGGYMHIYVDVDGDARPDLQIMAIAPTLSASDFIL